MPQQRPNVLIAGVAGYNRGDDAIARALIDLLRARFSLGEIFVTVLRPGVFDEPDVREIVIDRRKLSSHVGLLRAISQSAFVVIGGGSIIQDEFGAGFLRGIMALFAEIVLLCRLCSRPVVTAPIGIDTLTSERGERVARTILRACALVAVRDETSLANARRLLGPEARITLAADPAFCLPRERPLLDDAAPHLVLAPAFEANTADALPALFARIIERFFAAHDGARCTILAMDERVDEDGGRIATIRDRVLPELRGAVELVVPRSITAAIDVLRSAHALIAMRLHAVILSAGITPTLCLSRGTKTDAIARELGVPMISLRAVAAPGAPDMLAIEARAAEFLRELQTEAARARLLGASAAAAALHTERMQHYLATLHETLAPGIKLGAREPALPVRT